MRVAVVHPGIQHALNEACGLAANGHDIVVLTRLALSQAEAESRWCSNLASRFPLRVAACPNVRVERIGPWDEVLSVVVQRLVPMQLWRDISRPLLRRFGHAAERRLVEIHPQVVVGFDTASAGLFQGLESTMPHAVRVLEATIAPPPILLPLLDEAASRYPAWRPTIDVSRHPKDGESARVEAGLAHVVVAGSDFVASSYRALGVADEKLIINPYGSSFTASTGLRREDRRGFLFCGRPGIRKGLPDLLSVARELPPGEPLHVVGGVPPRSMLEGFYLDNVRFHGRLTSAEVRTLMQQVRATVLPSYGEGLSKVLGEALSQGSAVIATPNTGIQTLVQANPALTAAVALVEPGAPRQLLDTMLRVDELSTGRAIESSSWEDHGARVLAALPNLVG